MYKQSLNNPIIAISKYQKLKLLSVADTEANKNQAWYLIGSLRSSLGLFRAYIILWWTTTKGPTAYVQKFWFNCTNQVISLTQLSNN